MTVVYGTLGFTPSKLLPTVTRHPDVTKLVFYHDRHPKSRAAAMKVRQFARERGLEAKGVEIDAFDVIDCARRMRKDMRADGAQRVVFNITGGTPVLSSAATLACLLEGARAVYVHDETKEEVALPFLTMRADEVLSPEARRVLSYVIDHPGVVQAEVARALKLSRATLNHHVHRLKARRLVEGAPDAKDARRERLTALPAAVLVAEDA